MAAASASAASAPVRAVLIGRLLVTLPDPLVPLIRLQASVYGRVDPGVPVVELLVPAADDYYVLKPMHSGFYCTSLDVLLEQVGVHTVIITGMAAEICVLFTANDAYMRGFRVVVPADCVAAERAEDNAHALRQMERLLKADTTTSDSLDLHELATPA